MKMKKGALLVAGMALCLLCGCGQKQAAEVPQEAKPETAAAEQKVKELKVENQQLHSRMPSMKEKLKEAEERQRLINENRNLQVQVEYLENSLDSERNFASRLLEGVEAVLDFLDRHLPEQFRPMLERARELLPVPELQQPEQEQDRGHTWGGMEL